MKLSTKQVALIEVMHRNDGKLPTTMRVDDRTLNSLIKKGLVERVAKERFVEDNREMYYWIEYRLVAPKLIQALS
jgi:hypothetical protein